MRVIAASARRLPLAAPKGMNTRPTQDRIKETLFNILHNDVPGCVFLDLYAGSGQMGIEALSRGARRAVFVDQNKDANLCIKKNLEKTKLEEKAKVICSDVCGSLASWNEGAADIVFIDPPYESGLENITLNALKQYHVIDENTQIIIEAALGKNFEDVEELGFTIDKVKTYKTNQHVFLSLQS